MLDKEKSGIGLIVGLIIIVIVAFLVLTSKEDDVQNIEVSNNSGTPEVVSQGSEMAAGFFKPFVSFEDLSEGPENKVIYFSASWCPSCRVLKASLNTEKIPERLGIYDVDYDTATELKQKYSITSQHALVQVDSEGNLITKWLGGNDVDSIVRKLK